MLTSGHLSELTIHVVERQDNGLYTCVASNAFGQDEKNNQLTVQGTFFLSQLIPIDTLALCKHTVTMTSNFSA